MKLKAIAVLGIILVLAGAVDSQMTRTELRAPDSFPGMPYKNPKLPVEQRVADLLGRMTLEEKAAMLAGASWMESVPNARLGIPAIKMADGPMGVRAWWGPSAHTNAAGSPAQVATTAFPSSIAVAAAWNPPLVEQQGRVIGQQTKAWGRDMILAPTVNINRVPLWGRNFEGYGEDPYLTSRLAVAYIKGVQSEGVIATVKHFATNNQEFERHRIDVRVDERTLHEIYFPAFKAAVQEAGVWSVMSAYNKINGQWCAENASLLTDVLRRQWGFKGFVVSDWGSTYSTAETVNAGLDLEMPGGEPMRLWLDTPRAQQAGHSGGWLTKEKILAAIEAGRIKVAQIDDAVGRLLQVMFTAGLFEQQHTETRAVDLPPQIAVARMAATQGTVLLKNAGDVLPLSASKVRSMAVIGPSAAVARTGGGGSSLVRPKYAISPLDGIRESAGQQVPVGYALGVPMEGEEASQDTSPWRQEALELAAKSDVAVVVVGHSPKLESEGFDRQTMDLPAGQDELIEAVAAANKNTVVVLVTGAPVTMRWLDRVPAVLQAWYGGQEGGHAIADILFGAATPSGKLPVTFPKALKDSPAYGHYPEDGNLQVEYAEGIYVGYRGFDQKNVEPLFPFGHGLSYTTFEYSDLKITPEKAAPGQPVQVTVTVRNTGPRPGAEVVQLYLRDVESSVDRPVKELKGFRRVELAAGQSQTVTLTLDQAALSFYDVKAKGWVAEPGAFEVQISASSRDIRLKGWFELLH